jgi:hypothetical protein
MIKNAANTFSDSQTLITGVYRTGSEYLSLLLDSHPDISVSMYRVNVLRFVFGRYSPIDESHNLRKAISDTASRLLERYEIILDQDKLFSQLSQLKNIDYGVFYDAMMSQLYLGNGVRHWAEKDQLLWREIPQFINMMPNGKAIHILRDPRSVLASFKKYTRYEPPAFLGAVFNSVDAFATALDHQKSMKEKVAYIRYEDLVRGPQQIIDKLWQFLNLRAGFDIKGQGDWKDAYGNSWHSNSSYHINSQEDKFDIERAVNGWKNNLSIEEINMAEAICGEVMDKFGYKRSMDSPDAGKVEKMICGDKQLEGAFANWKETGYGFESFPEDPLDRATWDKPND